MSHALERALERGRRTRGRLIARAARAPNYNLIGQQGGATASLLSLAHGQDTILGQIGQQGQMTNHREQERHLTGWVFACVRAIAQRIAGQPIRVARLLDRGTPKAHLTPRREYLPRHLKQQQDRMELVDDHAILDVVERPNTVMTRWALSFVTAATLETTGKSHWWTYKDEDAPTGWTILPLPSSWVRPIHAGDKIFSSFMVRPGNATQEIPVPGDEMAYIHYPDPSNPLGALSPLQAISREVVADEAISEATRRSFSNGIWGGYAIRMGRNLDADGKPTGPRARLSRAQRGQIMAAILQAYRGVMNFDQPVILDGLIEDITKISNSPREMEFLKSRGVTKEAISQGFGVNPIILGQVEGANRASAASADDHFCSSCINPKLELISQILTAFVAPRFAAPGERLLLYYEPAHSYDPGLEIQRQQMLLGCGGLEINELRQQIGLQPKPGGDIALMPSSMQPYNLEEEYDFEAAQEQAQAVAEAHAAAHGAAQGASGAANGPPAGEGGQDAAAGRQGGQNGQGGAAKSAGRFPELGNARKGIW